MNTSARPGQGLFDLVVEALAEAVAAKLARGAAPIRRSEDHDFDELAAYFGVSESTVSRWVNREHLFGVPGSEGGPYLIGQRLRVPDARFREYVDRLKAPRQNRSEKSGGVDIGGWRKHRPDAPKRARGKRVAA